MKSTLSANHIRSISASMTVVERLINDIESSMSSPFNGSYERYEVDISEESIIKNRKIIDEIKIKLKNFQSEYNLTSRTYGVSQIIYSRKSRCWEVLQETVSKQLRGYGQFPEELAEPFDREIKELIKLIETLQV
jgi:hypothetical protein